jgi:hypothetical protein
MTQPTQPLQLMKQDGKTKTNMTSFADVLQHPRDAGYPTRNTLLFRTSSLFLSLSLPLSLSLSLLALVLSLLALVLSLSPFLEVERLTE